MDDRSSQIQVLVPQESLVVLSPKWRAFSHDQLGASFEKHGAVTVEIVIQGADDAGGNSSVCASNSSERYKSRKLRLIVSSRSGEVCSVDIGQTAFDFLRLEASDIRNLVSDEEENVTLSSEITVRFLFLFSCQI